MPRHNNLHKLSIKMTTVKPTGNGNARTTLKESKIPKEVLERFSLLSLQGEVTGTQKLMKSYPVKGAQVLIVDDNGRGLYLIKEPDVTDQDKELYRQLMGGLYYSLKPISDLKSPLAYVESYLNDAVVALKPDATQETKDALLYYIGRDVAGYGILDVPMTDSEVEEVECNGYSTPLHVVHREFSEYMRLESNIHFQTEKIVADIVQRLAQRAGKSVTIAYPFTDFILPEGHRGAVTYGNEISLPGSTFDIRKFPLEPLTITALLKYGTISPLMAAYEWLIDEHRGFTLLIGTVGSGKTTMLNALLSTLHPSSKILTVEDTPEIRIAHENWIRFITRSAYTIGAREVGLFDLVKTSLRYRPDYLVVGEVRGEEIQSLVQAAAVGHGASTTIHAESPEAALVRMRSPPLSVGESFLMLIWNILQMERVTMSSDKQVRRVMSITEVVPSGASFELKELFNWDVSTDTFHPDDAREVASRSERLKIVASMRGWSQDELVAELNSRVKFLQSLMDNNLFTYKEVTDALFAFWSSRRAGVQPVKEVDELVIVGEAPDDPVGLGRVDEMATPSSTEPPAPTAVLPEPTPEAAK